MNFFWRPLLSSTLRMVSCIWMATWLWMAGASWAQPAQGDPLLRAERRAVVRAKVAALLMSGQQGGRIPLQVLALPGIGPGGETAIVVEASGSEIMEGFEGTALDVEVFVYALDSRQEVISRSSQHLALDLRRHRTILGTGGIQSVTFLRLPPGSALLRVLVRSASGNFGLKSSLVEIDPSGGSARPHFPILPAPRGSWLIAVDPKEGDRDPVLLYPFRFGDETFVPSPRPVLEAVAEVPVLLLGRWPSDVGQGARFWLRNLGTGEETSGQVRRVEPGPNSIGGLDSLSVVLDLSAQKAGGHALKISLPMADAEDWVTPELEVWLTTPTRGPAPPQVAVQQGLGQRGLGQQGSEQQNAGLQNSKKSAPHQKPTLSGLEAENLKTLSAAYREVLGYLGKGDEAAAGRALQSLVQKGLEFGEKAPEALAESLSLLVKTLPSSAWEGLFALALAHGEAAADLFAQKNYAAGNLSSLLGVRLAEARADRLASSEATQEGSRLLTAMAVTYLELGAAPRCEELLRRSLVQWPENQEALLLLASGAEKRGDAGRAAQLLGRLVRLDPGHEEARLRWAINVSRLGNVRKAKQLLRELWSTDGTDWVRAVAAQELARLEIASHRELEAEEILREASRRWPQNPRFRLQMVALLEAQNRPLEARDWLRQIAWKEDARLASERHRYNSRSRVPTSTTHEVLQEKGKWAGERLGQMLRASVPLSSGESLDPIPRALSAHPPSIHP